MICDEVLNEFFRRVESEKGVRAVTQRGYKYSRESEENLPFISNPSIGVGTSKDGKKMLCFQDVSGTTQTKPSLPTTIRLFPLNQE